MFEFVKDTWLAGHGVDTETVRARRAEETEEKKRGKYIFGIKTKIAISILAVLYVGVNIWTLVSKSSFNASIMFDILLCIIAVGIGICVWIGKKGEIAAVIGIVLLVAGIYTITML